MSGGRDPTQGSGLGLGRDMEVHGPDTILYYARAGNLEGVMAMVKADPTQVNESKDDGCLFSKTNGKGGGEREVD